MKWMCIYLFFSSQHVLCFILFGRALLVVQLNYSEDSVSRWKVYSSCRYDTTIGKCDQLNWLFFTSLSFTWHSLLFIIWSRRALMIWSFYFRINSLVRIYTLRVGRCLISIIINRKLLISQIKWGLKSRLESFVVNQQRNELRSKQSIANHLAKNIWNKRSL